jgi:hypothetical protein
MKAATSDRVATSASEWREILKDSNGKARKPEVRTHFLDQVFVPIPGDLVSPLDYPVSYPSCTISSSAAPLGNLNGTFWPTFAFMSALAIGDSQLTSLRSKSASSTPTIR